MGFARAIVFAAQNYRDTMQSVLPSYRERIVQIRFAANEGGLNLAMDRKTIETIQRKGEQAGQVILDSFKFSHHQWVRFQVLMALIERQLKDLEGALQVTYYEKLMQDQLARQKETNKDERYPYPRSENWCAEAVRRIEALLDLIQQLNTQAQLVEDSPKPRPVLRVTPEL